MSPEVPEPGTVPVTAVILAQDEAVGIEAAVRSVAWCSQVVVVDSGSTDGTQEIAAAAGAEVWAQPWRGYGAQREYALHHPAIVHDWVFFLDADEWVSGDLAREIAHRVGQEGYVAYRTRLRLVFLGHWIRHCGWYERSAVVRLMDRRHSSWPPAVYGERAVVDGRVGTLACDIINEDLRGLARWLTKHVGYAELEARRRREARGPLSTVVALARSRRERARASVPRTIVKDVVWPAVPAKSLVLFVYMFLIRGGWRDGRVGFAFCFYHSWHHFTIGLLGQPEAGAGPAPRGTLSPFDDLAPYGSPPAAIPAAGVPGPRQRPSPRSAAAAR